MIKSSKKEDLTLKTFYELTVYVEATSKCQTEAFGCAEGLNHSQKITVISPEIRPSLLDIVATTERVLPAMITSYGKYRAECVLEKDQLYPGEKLAISI